MLAIRIDASDKNDRKLIFLNTSDNNGGAVISIQIDTLDNRTLELELTAGLNLLLSANCDSF